MGLSKAYARGDCCKAMHACVEVCVWAWTRRNADGDCCKAMYACVEVCLWACPRRMLAVIAARQGMSVLFCVPLCTMRMLTVIAARRCMLSVVCVFVPYEADCLVCALRLLFFCTKILALMISCLT